MLSVQILKDENISTHSLTRRLTRKPYQVHRTRRYFNSQPHKEADEKKALLISPETFQLTASQGG